MKGEICHIKIVPAVDAYVSAFRRATIDTDLRRALLVHVRAPNAKLLRSELSRISEVPIIKLNKLYGGLEHEVRDILVIDVPPYSRTNPKPFFTSAIAEASRPSSGARWSWRLYPEVCAAIDRLDREVFVGSGG